MLCFRLQQLEANLKATVVDRPAILPAPSSTPRTTNNLSSTPTTTTTSATTGGSSQFSFGGSSTSGSSSSSSSSSNQTTPAISSSKNGNGSLNVTPSGFGLSASAGVLMSPESDSFLRHVTTDDVIAHHSDVIIPFSFSLIK